MSVDIFVLILTLLSGVALFLYGMSVMGAGLKAAAGNRLELILYKLTNTPLKGMLLGAAVTAIIQSSSATSVMVVGFVNSGMMKLAQAIGIVMGSRIGTSVTGWIICLSYIDGQEGIAKLLSTATISAIVAILGILFKTFAKKEVMKNLGNIMLGFAVLMIGMQTMSGAVAPLKDSPLFINALTSFTNPILGIVLGLVLTAVLQSVSASVGVLQALSVTGAVSFASLVPMLLGAGIGASCPVLLAALDANTGGKQTAFIYLLDEIIAALIGAVIFGFLAFSLPPSLFYLPVTPFLIALINTLYRLITTVLILPFVKTIGKVTMRFIPKSAEEEDDEDEFALLEEHFLAYPAIAVSQSHKAITTMAMACQKNLERAFELYAGYNESAFNYIEIRENKIDKYEDKIGRYLMQLTGKGLSDDLGRDVTEYLHSISDFERIGDLAFGIAKVCQNLAEKGVTFSHQAEYEMQVLETAAKEIVNLAIAAFDRKDLDLAYRIEPLKDVIKLICDELKIRHVNRLSVGLCNFDVGFGFNEILTDCERIGAHCSNIAICIIELANNKFDSHAYLSAYRHGEMGSYAKYFHDYNLAYQLEPDNSLNNTNLQTH